MKAHHLLFPFLLIIGIGECVALNLVAGRGESSARGCPEAPKCPNADASVDVTVESAGPKLAPPSASASAAPEDNDSNDALAVAPPPQDAIQLPFAPQSALFENHARREMFKIARAMKDDPDKKLKLIGHSDVTTDGDRAAELSERRAKSCRDFIVQLGVSRSRVSYEARPPSKSTNTAESGRHRAVTAIWQ